MSSFCCSVRLWGWGVGAGSNPYPPSAGDPLPVRPATKHDHTHLRPGEPEAGGALYEKARRKKLALAGMWYAIWVTSTRPKVSTSGRSGAPHENEA